MVKEGDWQHGDAAAQTDAAENPKKVFDGAEIPAEDTKVFVDADTEGVDAGERWLPYIIAAFFLSFVFPPLGCFAFCLSLNAPSGSKRAAWGEWAVRLGSLLSFLYTFLLAMLLSEFYYIPNSGAILGYGY